MSKRGHGRLFKPEFEPIAQIGDVVALRNDDGFITDDGDTPFYVVTHVEAAPLLGQKGVVGIWCATNTPGAPYLMDKATVVGQNAGVSIAAGQTLTYQPDFLTLVKRQVMQMRALVRAVPDSDGDALTGVIDDYDVTISVPAASQRFGTQRLSGVLNAWAQGTLPSDTIAAPAQGSNATATTNTQRDVMELAARTELFVYGDSNGNGQIGIKNNGSGTASDGCIALQVAMFLSNLYPLSGAGATDQSFLGYNVPVPPGVDLRDVIVIPVSAQNRPKSAGA